MSTFWQIRLTSSFLEDPVDINVLADKADIIPLEDPADINLLADTADIVPFEDPG